MPACCRCPTSWRCARPGGAPATWATRARARAAAAAALKEELDACVLMVRGAAASAATDGVEHLGGEFGGASAGDLTDWLAVAMRLAVGNRRALHSVSTSALRAGCSAWRCAYELQPRGAGCAMQAVMCLSEPQYGAAEPVEVEVEELRFLAADGALLAEYGIRWALDNSRCSVHSLRLGAAAAGGPTGFGRLQPRPMSEAAPHFSALTAAAAAQPLRAADGRWADGLLLPAIHSAVTERYKLQLS